MKKILLISVLSLQFYCIRAQESFSFIDTIFVFNKSTDYETLHWYIEIFNNQNVDTTLRWKANFSSDFPKAWDINFDDQNNFYSNIKHNDSADFTLFANNTFPQKLIIGNAHNQYASTGDTLRFDIYHPNNPSNFKSIYFVFNITSAGGSLSINNSQVKPSLSVYPNPITNLLNLEHFEGGIITIFNNQGALIKEVLLPKNTTQISLDELTPGYYIIKYKDSVLPIIKKGL